jgi:hypothetical protein
MNRTGVECLTVSGSWTMISMSIILLQILNIAEKKAGGEVIAIGFPDSLWIKLC